MQIMTAVGFEPTQLALVELESTPLDHSGKLSLTLSSVSSLVAFSFFNNVLRSSILSTMEEQACRYGSCGLMDKALVFGTKDCRFESCQDHLTCPVTQRPGPAYPGSGLAWTTWGLSSSCPPP